MQEFSDWLASTTISQSIEEMLWIIPAVQCVHLVAIAVVLSSVLMMNLRIFDVSGRSQSLIQTTDRFLPSMWWALAVLVITGVVLIVGEPHRELLNVAFWAKMALLALAALAMLVFDRSIRWQLASGELSDSRQRSIRRMSLVVCGIWCAIAIAGRWIAYANTGSS